jgi:hypothetical protein
VLAAFQEAFVLLSADARLRRAFAHDPEAALAPFQLGVGERAALLAIPFARWEGFARSLLAKRWGELARVVPLTLRVVPSLGDRYLRWAGEHPARVCEGVLSPGSAEGLRALEALHTELAADECEALYAADLLAFEVLRAASRGDGVVRTLSSRFEIPAIATSVGRGLLPVDPELRPMEVHCTRTSVHWRPL